MKSATLMILGLSVACSSMTIVSAHAQDVSFLPPRDFVAGELPFSVAVGDFNGDQIMDLAVANHVEAGTVAVLLGRGDGSFDGPNVFAVERFPSSLTVA